jgi:hypothetical protein
VRVRHVIAGVAAAAWIVAFSSVINERSSLLDFLIPFVAMLIFGAIAWPDDFKRNPSSNNDEPPTP